MTLVTRWRPNYAVQLTVRREEIDCAAGLHEIRPVGQRSTLELEQVLTRLRLPTILANIARGEKVLICTHLVEGIAKELLDAIKAAGHSPGLLTGETDDTNVREFLKPNGSVDVLIASSRIGTASTAWLEAESRSEAALLAIFVALRGGARMDAVVEDPRREGALRVCARDRARTAFGEELDAGAAAADGGGAILRLLCSRSIGVGQPRVLRRPVPSVVIELLVDDASMMPLEKALETGPPLCA